MSKLGKEIFTSLDLNGPYIRIDTQPTSVTKESVHGNGGTGRESRYTATFTTAGSVYYLTGDSAEVGDDNIVEEDAVAPTVSSTGTITYQWYEVIDSEPNIDVDFKLVDGTSNQLAPIHAAAINDVNIVTTGANFSGTTTPTLTITNLQSPGDNARQFYCVIGYKIPEDDLRTGNIINDELTTDVVTLTVLPHIIIDEQPVGNESQITEVNTISFSSRLSDNRFENDFTYQWYEVNEDGTEFLLTDGETLSAPIVNGTRTSEFITQAEREEDYTKTTIDELHVPFTNDDGTTLYGARVGIPTQVSEVIVKISGASGGVGGDEGAGSLGGAGGKGTYGNFKFSPELISRINNSNEPQDFTIFAGSAGENGPSRTNDINTFARGGICAASYGRELENAPSATYGSAGDGGYAGPDGLSGGGGAGGGFSGIFDVEGDRWLAIAGGGGGGGGASELRSGADGENAGNWEEVLSTNSTSKETTKQATVVNFNPRCTTVSGETIKIDYGFYTKTTNSNNQVLNAGTYDRLIIIWDGEVKYDETDSDAIKDDLLSDDDGVYISINNIRYYVGTHRGSQLGWCDDDTDCGVCTRLKSEADDLDNRIDVARDRKTGGYANSFDVKRVEMEADPESDDATLLDDVGIYGAFGINGADKVSGDGGGGGGGGAGAFTDSRGGNAGTDAVNSALYQITVSVQADNTISDDAYISFKRVDVDTGETVSFYKSNRNNTLNITFKTGAVYDVVSSIDDGLTSEGIRVLPDLNRSIGLDLSGTISPDEIPSDILLSLGDGVFRTVPRTVFVDGEFIGTSIIQFVVPSEKTVNQTAAEGGEGGRSAYLFDNASKHHLIKEGQGSTLNDTQGHVELKFTTKEPFDVLNDVVETVELSFRRSHNGTKTQTLNTNSEYTFSKFYKCRIFSNICSPIPTLDTDTAIVSMTDNARGILFVEAIGTDNFARTYSRNLNNVENGIDVKLYPSTETGTNKVRYYSLYTKYDTDVDIRLYGGQGKDRTYGSTTYSGGLGGMSYFRLRMKANTEYVIAGLDSTINTPFLFEKGSLLATVGSGGDAGNTGNGGVGSGINVRGGDAPSNGGTGARKYTTLRENGVHGSASILTNLSPGDGKALGNNGGYTKKCTTGKYWAEDANPPVSPCVDIPGSTKFRLSDGTEVINTAEIARGFKTGNNIFVTGGLGPNGIGNGGNGAGGGSGNLNGGGGGSGYAEQSANFFLRDRVRDPLLEPESPDGTDSGSASGINEGQPYVEISLADISTQDLRQFREYPEDIIVGTDQLELLQQGIFEPLPIIEAPRDATAPIPIKKISAVYINNSLKSKPGPGETPLDVNEGDTIKIDFRTEKIPPNSRFYWRLVSNNSNFDSNDVSSLEGDFTTAFLDDDSIAEKSTCQGSFEFSITNDLLTEFTSSVEEFGLNIYSNSDRTVIVSGLQSRTFNIVDTSRSAPTATITTIPSPMSEGHTQTFFVKTTDIPIYPDVFPAGNTTLNWEIINITTSNDDFVNTSGTFDITVDDPVNSVTGTGSFTVEAKEDFTTEGESEEFSLKISYNGTVLFDGNNEGYKVTINDTSLDPVYTLTPASASMNEHGSSFASGDTETYTLSTQYVRSGSTFYYKVVSGHDNADGSAALASDDFSNYFGTFTVTGTTLSSSGTFNVVTKPDALSESAENFTVQVHKTTAGDYNNNAVGYPLSSSLVARQNLTVNNTTETTFLLHESGNQNTKSKTINEGESLTLNVYGRFAPDSPETVYWRIYKSDGATIADSSDWDNATSGSVTLPQSGNEGNVEFTITPANDLFTDGDIPEKFFVKLSLDSNYSTLISDSSETSGHLEFEIDVVDTSRNPIYQFQTEDGFTDSFVMDEGNSKNMQLTIENISAGDVFYWEILKTHNTTTKSRADDADWSPISGTVTSTGFDSHTLSWTITGLADQVTEPTSSSSSSGMYFTIRVTTGNYYSQGGDELPTGLNGDSINNFGRITIILRDTSKAPPTYSITSSKTVDEGQTSSNYTIKAFRDTRGGLDGNSLTRFNDFTLYYSIVYRGTSTLASTDLNNASGEILFSYYSSSSSGALEHRNSSFNVTPKADLILDGSDERFDLLLFSTSAEAQSPSDNTPIVRFSSFLTIDDTSFPQYALDDGYSSTATNDTTLYYNEGKQDFSGNPEWYNVYLYSNLDTTFYWQLTYPKTAASLTWNSTVSSNFEDGNNNVYRGSVSPTGATGGTSNFGTYGASYSNVYYAIVQFWAPRDFTSSSDVFGTFKLFSDSGYTNEVKSSSVEVDNDFSIPSSPSIYNTSYMLYARSSSGSYFSTASTHNFSENNEPMYVDTDGDVYVKGAQSVDAKLELLNSSSQFVSEIKTWSKSSLKWLSDSATSSSSNYWTTHYLKDLFSDWRNYSFSSWNSSYGGYKVRLTITATNPGGSRTTEKTRTLNYKATPTPTPTNITPTPTTLNPPIVGTVYMRRRSDFRKDYYSSSTLNHEYTDNREPMYLGWRSDASGYVQRATGVTVTVATYRPNGTQIGSVKQFSASNLDYNATNFLKDIFSDYTTYKVGASNNGSGGWSRDYDGYTVTLTVTATNKDNNPVSNTTSATLKYIESVTPTPDTITPTPDTITPTPDTITPTPEPTIYEYKTVPLYRYVATNSNDHKRYIMSLTRADSLVGFQYDKLVGYCFFNDPSNGYYVPKGAKRIDDGPSVGVVGGLRITNSGGGGYRSDSLSLYYAYPYDKNGNYVGNWGGARYALVNDGNPHFSPAVCSVYIDTRVGDARRANSNINGWPSDGDNDHPYRDDWNAPNAFVLNNSNSDKFDDDSGSWKWQGDRAVVKPLAGGIGRWKNINGQDNQWVRNWLRYDGNNGSGAVRWGLVGDQTWRTTVPPL